MTKAAKTQQALKIQGANGLEWQPVQVKLGDLDGWQGNPKRLSKLQAQRLLQSTQSLGQLQTIAVSPVKPDGRRDLYDGHQRDGVWSKAYNPSLTVWAMEASRPLTDDERKDVAVLSMTARGSFDWDILANWEGLGGYFAADDLAELRRDIAALDLFLGSEADEEKKDFEFQDVPEQYAVLITCETEEAQNELLERFLLEGLECRALLS